ncbi:MAG: MBL fold metallo-hydrolase [Desulfovibrio sp.]|nr:MBL fold metallo-hydrolase [Desulfovibrio sp.]
MLLQIPVQGFFAVNAYVYADDSTMRGFLVDPGAEAERLLDIIADKNLVIERILLTHGHFDHLGAADALRKALGVPIGMALEGRAYAEDPWRNLSAQCGSAITLEDVDYFDASQRPLLTAGTCRLMAVPVPGHSPDSVLYRALDEDLAFVGDTIFRGSVGTSQFPGGDAQQLRASLVREILPLPGQTVLYSGHSEATTVAREKATLQALAARV